MKYSFLVLSLLFLALLGNISHVHGQIFVTSELIPQDNGPDILGYSTTIPFSGIKTTTETWNNYLGDSSYGWESKKNGVHRHKGVREKSISEKKFTVYNEFVNTDKGVRLTVWFTQNGRPLVPSASGDDLNIAVINYIHDYAIDQYRSGLQLQLKVEQNRRREIQLELAHLTRGQEKKRTALSKENFDEQSGVLVESIKEQNLKMHALLQSLNTTN